MYNSTEQLMADARNRTPDKWYFNQYVDGNLALSSGFPTKELAESFAKKVEDVVSTTLRCGFKLRENVLQKVEEAKGWEVNGKTFKIFADALFYKWTKYPNAQVKGVF